MADKIDFTRNPFKGVFTTVAKKRGCSQPNVSKGYKANNPDIVRDVAEEVKLRLQVFQELRELEEANVA